MECGVRNEEEESEEEEGEDPERIRLEREDKFIRKQIDPQMLSEDEVKMHELQGHIPYRNWCETCVKAMGREKGHRTEDKERKVPEYHLDYYFPGDELGYKWTVLIGKERISGSFMANSCAVQNRHHFLSEAEVKTRVSLFAYLVSCDGTQ